MSQQMQIPPGPPNPLPRTGEMSHLSKAERMEAWFQMMEEHDRFTRQWFAERIEPGQNIEEVLTEYYQRQINERDSFIIAVAKGVEQRNVARREGRSSDVK